MENGSQIFKVSVKGDWADTVARDGDVLVFDNTIGIKSGDIALVKVKGRQLVRKVEISNEEIKLIPLSSNPIYQTEIYPLSEVLFLAKAIFAYSYLE